MSASIGELIEAGDLNGLLAVVDGLCAAREWGELLDLADRCEEAVERGKQLWPIAAHIDYRIALESPAEYAAGVLRPTSGRWSHGPLTEVAASTHTWTQLAPFIEEPQIAAFVAQERVLRGEVLEGDGRTHPEILELPLRVTDWEPIYCLATFRADHVEVAEVWEPRLRMERFEPKPGEELDEPELVGALLDLVTPWTTESNGAARALVVEGGAVQAASLLAYDSFFIGPLTPAEALQRMAWAAASGGAHGRRRGAAFGRFAAWHVSALLVDQPWPPPLDRLGSAVNQLTWWRWDEDPAHEGWSLRLAVADERAGWAAAIAATDVLESGDS
jgi:Family of unknown function (DUF6183)